MVTVQELVKEVNLLKQDATIYRQQTAELSLKVLKTVQDVIPFFNQASVQQVVSSVLTSADRDCQLDVAKMLHVLFVQMSN